MDENDASDEKYEHFAFYNDTKNIEVKEYISLIHLYFIEQFNWTIISEIANI